MNSYAESRDALFNKGLFLVVAVLTAVLIVALHVRADHPAWIDDDRCPLHRCTAAAMADPDVHQEIQAHSDQDSPDHKTLESQLRHAGDANRRRDIHVDYIYSMRPYLHDSRTAEFVLDAEEEGVNKSNVGDIGKTNPNYVVRFNDFQADEEFVIDQWGQWSRRIHLSATPAMKLLERSGGYQRNRNTATPQRPVFGTAH